MSDIGTEPTMEEILSSIKKIIAEDSSKTLSPVRPRRAEPRPPSHDELGEPVEAGAAPADDADDDVLELTAEAVQPALVEPVPAPIADASPIASEAVLTASRSALASLSSLVVKPEIAGSDTLEGLVRDMLRPMLKDWLDSNLPEVVERMVAQEVARISGR